MLGSSMENLPHDILIDIFSRLSMISLLRTKCVCKAWLAAAEDPYLPTLFHAEANERNPSLVLHSDSFVVKKLSYIGYEEGSHHYSNKALKIVPPFVSNMPDFQVVGSCNGLLCISDALSFDSFYICNIFTGDYIELPKTSPHGGQEAALGFGYHPVTEEYKIVRLVYNCKHGAVSHHQRLCPLSSDVQILKVGTDDSWRSLGPTCWMLDLRPSEALVNGALHWVTYRHLSPHRPCLRIVSFDLADEKFKEIEPPICGSLNNCNFHLVTVKGCLSAVSCRIGDIEIWVMLVYKEKESWTKDYVIRASIPAIVHLGWRPKSKFWKSWTPNKGDFEVVCILDNGDIVMLYEEGALVLYSPASDSFKEMDISGLPGWFSVITLHEFLFSAKALLGSRNVQNSV